MMRQHVYPDSRLHGRIVEAGTAGNIIPDEAVIEFGVRSPRRAYMEYLYEWVKDIAKAAALATRTTAEIMEPDNVMTEIYVAEEGRELMRECFAEVGEILPRHEGRISGSSDIGIVGTVTPAFQPMMGIGSAYDVHSREFAAEMTEEKTHNTIIRAAKWLIYFVTKMYDDPERLKRIQKKQKEYFSE